MRTRLFPLFTDLRNKAVLVVGGGAVAERKISALLRSGAQVTVVAPEFRPELAAMGKAGRIRCEVGEFFPFMLEGKWLVIAATDDRAVNLRVSEAAAGRHMLVNVVDDPEISSFQVPSIVDRAPLVIAVSTSGAAPVFARRVRERIEALFDHSLGALTQLAAERREAIRQSFPDMASRRAFYDDLFDGPVTVALRKGDRTAAEAAFDAALAQAEPLGHGRVVVVGAGPGPAAMLTLQGLRALNEADVIVYLAGVTAEVRDLARRDAEQIAWDQGEPALALDFLLEHARQGRCGVLLCYGDAAFPGRDGEVHEGVRLEVVRGVGSGSHSVQT